MDRARFIKGLICFTSAHFLIIVGILFATQGNPLTAIGVAMVVIAGILAGISWRTLPVWLMGLLFVWATISTIGFISLSFYFRLPLFDLLR